MTQSAQVSFETQKADAPVGLILGGFAVSLMLAGAVISAITVTDKTTPIAFDVVPGTGYTVQVQRVATDGSAVLAPVSSAPFDVAVPPPEQIDVPLSVTVVLSAPTPAA